MRFPGRKAHCCFYHYINIRVLFRRYQIMLNRYSQSIINLFPDRNAHCCFYYDFNFRFHFIQKYAVLNRYYQSIMNYEL